MSLVQNAPPVVHQHPAFVEEIRSPVSAFHLVGHLMSERRLGDLFWIIRFVAASVGKRAAKAVDAALLLHVAQDLGQGHVRERRSCLRGKDQITVAAFVGGGLVEHRQRGS